MASLDSIYSGKEFHMKNRNEELLNAWLRLSIAISNERIVSDLPYNEALVCNLLYRTRLLHPQERMTATDLCQHTKILKSQMNRILQNLEDKGVITRVRSEQDKRQVFITMNTDSDLYKIQHDKILTLIDSFIEKIGIEKTGEVLDIFTMLADTAEEVIK